jgi:hypothetical protein
MKNPVLKRDLKFKLRIEKLIPAIISRYICIGIFFLLVIIARLGNGILAFLITEAVMILLFTSASICDAFVSQNGRRDFSELYLTRIKQRSIIFAKLISSNLYNFIVLIISDIAIFALQNKLNMQGIIYANLVLLTLMFAISILALLFCMIFRRNSVASIFSVYLVIIFLLFNVIIAGLFIERTENQKAKDLLTNSAVYANPIIMLSRSLGKIDLMRTDYMYSVADAIVGRGVIYPDWRISCTIYLAVSCLLLGVAILLSYTRKNTIRINHRLTQINTDEY